MLFRSLQFKAQRLSRRAKESAENHGRLSSVWARSLLAKKECALAATLIVASLFTEVYNEQLFFICATVLVFCCWFLPVRHSLRAVLTWQILSAAYAVGWANSFTPKIELALAANVTATTLLIISCCLGALAVARLNISVLGAICIGNALASLYHGAPNYEGISSVSTLNSVFTASLLPFAPPIFWPIILVAIFLCPGALAYAVVGVHLAVLSVRFRGYFIPLGCAVLGLIWFKRDCIPCSARGEMYQRTWEFFISGSNWISGFGPGSFQTLGPIVQSKFQPGEYWVALHCDWLQCLFETGFVGLALVLWAYIDMLVLNRNDTSRLSTLLGLGAFACFYHPFRVPAFALVFAVLIFECQQKRD